MIIHQRTTRNDELFAERATILVDPAWQRGPAWKTPRQVLLIDSILRGMDVPKVYLRRMPAGGAYAFEAVDGQQRLRAMWAFRDGALALTHPERLPPIDGHGVDGVSFGDLHQTLRDRFDAFEVSVAEIVEGTPDEVTNLFARLQMGVALNPAELRNAMLGPMRHLVDSVASSHEFFLDSRIPDQRYKRQDFAAHAFAMAVHRGRFDIKATNLKRMFADLDASRMEQVLECAAEVGAALNVLADVNARSRRRIVQKWVFVDLAWLVMQRQAAGAVVDADRLAAAYQAFEARRRQYNPTPELLVQPGRESPALDRHLYNYIQGFRVQAGLRSSVAARNAALHAFCPDIDARSE